MEPIEIVALAEREPMPGFRGRFVHTENMTLAYWRITQDAALPEHSHFHEQVVNVLEGELELTVGVTTRVLRPGAVWVIPSGIPHSGRALTVCRVLDVFQPVRDDYR